MSSGVELIANFHVHSRESKKDSAATPPQIVKACLKAGINCIALTNHDTTDGAEELKEETAMQGVNLLVIKGQESTTGETNSAGKRVEFLIYDAKETIERGLKLGELLKEIKKQKASVGVPYPFELWRHGAGEELTKELVARAEEMGIPVFLEAGNSRSSNTNNIKAEILTIKLATSHNGVFATLGSDAHRAEEIDRAKVKLQLPGKYTGLVDIYTANNNCIFPEHWLDDNPLKTLWHRTTTKAAVKSSVLFEKLRT